LHRESNLGWCHVHPYPITNQFYIAYGDRHVALALNSYRRQISSRLYLSETNIFLSVSPVSYKHLPFLSSS
jgi:hypothetical protein